MILSLVSPPPGGVSLSPREGETDLLLSLLLPRLILYLLSVSFSLCLENASFAFTCASYLRDIKHLLSPRFV